MLGINTYFSSGGLYSSKDKFTFILSPSFLIDNSFKIDSDPDSLSSLLLSFFNFSFLSYK
jgi:hypothetical protein